MNTPPIFDDIVVGAGSSGAVLASRLSEQSERRILLLEAGADFPLPDALPAELKDGRAPLMSGYHWNFSADVGTAGASGNLPQADKSQPFPYALGKVIGGSSSINGAVALRGLKEDFESWAALGNSEWDWAGVLPYFKKIESDHDFAGELHGTDGSLPITRPQAQDLHGLQSAFLQGCKAQGMAELADLNASSAPGVGAVPGNCLDHVRMSTATAWLAGARARKNLTVRADSLVSRVLFEGKQAIGVELLDAHGRKQAVFGNRVTLCAGAINTAAILLRSGVGDPAMCRSLGIAPVIDLPGVGQNLADHPSIVMWMKPRAGICDAAQPYHQIMARVGRAPGSRPDINLFMLSNVVTAKVPRLSDVLQTPLAAGISIVLMHSASRGRVSLDSAAPTSKPVIELNFGSAPEDVERLMDGVRLAWEIVAAPSLAAQIESHYMWSAKLIGNDGFLRSTVKRFIGATWHPVGTAKMGAAADPMAVVDQHCRVHRAGGLRVVDASVMPDIPSAPTNLTCIMLAERVAEWMKREWK